MKNTALANYEKRIARYAACILCMLAIQPRLTRGQIAAAFKSTGISIVNGELTDTIGFLKSRDKIETETAPESYSDFSATIITLA